VCAYSHVSSFVRAHEHVLVFKPVYMLARVHAHVRIIYIDIDIDIDIERDIDIDMIIDTNMYINRDM